jgi:hypothetical protein
LYFVSSTNRWQNGRGEGDFPFERKGFSLSCRREKLVGIEKEPDRYFESWRKTVAGPFLERREKLRRNHTGI